MSTTNTIHRLRGALAQPLSSDRNDLDHERSRSRLMIESFWTATPMLRATCSAGRAANHNAQRLGAVISIA